MALLTVALLSCLLVQASGSCSYDDSSLLNWDDPAAWENHVPAEGEFAVIKTGSKVRLNVSPTLKGITIESGATLVWGNFDGLVVTTDHIHVKGTFIIGDSDCPFTKKANIKLTGMSNTDNIVEPFGRKFIGIDEGGSLEIHGRPKKSWTKLIQTAPAAHDTCGYIFNLQENAYGNEGGNGLHVAAFNLDGSLFDFGVFKTANTDDFIEDKFKAFVEGIPNEKVLAITINEVMGVASVTRDWEKVYTTVEAAGGLTSTVLRDLQDRDAYAFITRTGDSSTTRENHVVNPNDDTTTSSGPQVYYDATADIMYRVNCKVHPTKNKQNDIQVILGDVAYPKIKLFHDVSSWLPGDRIIVASTDYEWEQAEEFSIMECSDCAANEVRLDHEFLYMHYGEITQGVDERGEVGMLSQSILIEGIMQDHCYEFDEKDAELCTKFGKDMHGGHLKAVRGFTAVHIEHAELYHMGQHKYLGSYPLHFHMCDDVDGNWFRANSIHNSLTRCVTIHGSDGAEVSDNVCYLTHGHSYFLEDSVEQRTILDGNLGLGTQHGNFLMTDMKQDWCNDTYDGHCDALSTFWITHPNNYIRNNVAAGGDNTGFWIMVSFKALGPSRARQEERQTSPEFHAFHSKILEFNNNVAHSYHGRGLRYDNRISMGEPYAFSDDLWVPENGMLQAVPAGEPREPPMPNGTLVNSIMSNFTAYKNRHQNVWMKVGNLIMERFSIADSSRGLSMSKGEVGTFTEVTESIFIGETDNLGIPEEPFGRSNPYGADQAIQGIEFYQGPAMVTDSFFDKYEHLYAEDVFRPAGGLGHKRDTPYPADPQSGTSGLKFGYCDTPDTNWLFRGYPPLKGFGNEDGNRQANIQDYDGTLTGTPGTHLVPRGPFFTTDRCDERIPWNMAVCPYKYGRALFKGRGGSFVTNDKDYPMNIRRDDRPDEVFSLMGEKGDNYLVIKNMSYTVNFNGTAPDKLPIWLQNFEKGEFLRVGLCYPSDSVFSFYGSSVSHSDPAFEVDTIEELDQDETGRAYLWDQARGLLFVKVIGLYDHDPANPQDCPENYCPRIVITRESGSDDTVDCYESAYGDGTYTRQEDQSSPIPGPSVCTNDVQPEEWGHAVATSEFPTEDLDITCYVPPTYPAPVDLGCYTDHHTYHDLPFELVELSQAMTKEFCSQRCYLRNYPYAAVQNGVKCYCGFLYGGYGEAPDACTKPCNGDKSQMCGEANINTVLATGIPPLEAMEPCGPDGNGVVYKPDTCLYLTDEAVGFADAQAACIQLGGSLASISSADDQFNVERYMRPVMVDAWFGLNDINEEGTLVYVSGENYDGSYSNFAEGHGSDDWEDACIVQASYMYSWNDKHVSNTYRALCQMSVDAQVLTAQPCGVNDLGKTFGSGCYAVINTEMSKKDAEYACFTRMGTIIEVNEQNRDEIINHIYMFGASEIDYWTIRSDYYELSYKDLYEELPTSEWTKDGVICALETLSANNPCSTGWSHHENKCFFYNAQHASSYSRAQEFCEQGASNVATVLSSSENDFVAALVDNLGSTHFFIALQYNDASGAFEWLDGSPLDYTNWKSGNGNDNLGDGKCARIRSKDKLWKNRDCNKGATVVCQAQSGQ